MMSDDKSKTPQSGASQASTGAMAPKSKRDEMRERMKKLAGEAGPPTDDWGTAEVPDGVTKK